MSDPWLPVLVFVVCDVGGGGDGDCIQYVSHALEEDVGHPLQAARCEWSVATGVCVVELVVLILVLMHGSRALQADPSAIHRQQHLLQSAGLSK